MSKQLYFIGSILNICYIRYNYVFRPWMLAIIRLYMKTYPLVIQIYVGYLQEIGKWLCGCGISFWSNKGAWFGVL